jgi:uncharacterized membrane protein
VPGMNPAPSSRTRIYSLDILRGAVMIVMALDHVRDFIHADAFVHNPLDFATTTPLLFFTRWITHFCAPTFVFLAGTSAFLQSQRKSKGELSSFLIKRGLWLIFIEVVVITFAWTFNPHYNVIILQVIWVIGISMVLLGLLIWLPYKILLPLGLLIVFGHNAFDHNQAIQNSGLFWDVAMKGNFAVHCITPDHCFLVIYAVVPWLGLMILGYCFGKLYRSTVDGSYRKKMLIYLGVGLILLFIVLRAFNIYGDPHPWSMQKNPVYSFLSFINVNKYPPSLLFLCITIGPAMLILALLENFKNQVSRAITVFGRVPFFFYVIHLYLIHFISMILFFSRGHSFQEGVAGNSVVAFHFFSPGEGVYLIWIIVVLSLYPLCKWFNDYKNRNPKWWLSYL